MEPENEIARVSGLGRGSVLGFTLILTDQRIVGVDARRTSIRLWLSMMLGLGLGMIVLFLVLFGGVEPFLFRINPLLDFVAMLSLVFSLPILFFALIPRLLRRRIRRSGYSTVQALRKDIIRIDVQKPGKVTQKGYFTVRLFNGSSFSFWTVGQDMFDHVSLLLTSFAPGQMSDSSLSTGEFVGSDLVRPSNKLVVAIIASLIILITISAIGLQPFLSLPQFVGVIIGIVVIHGIGYVGYRSLRRVRRACRKAV